MNNPLLANSPLPLFSQILPEHVEMAVDYVLDQGQQNVEALLATLGEPTWQSLVVPMEELDASFINTCI